MLIDDQQREISLGQGSLLMLLVYNQLLTELGLVANLFYCQVVLFYFCLRFFKMNFYWSMICPMLFQFLLLAALDQLSIYISAPFKFLMQSSILYVISRSLLVIYFLYCYVCVFIPKLNLSFLLLTTQYLPPKFVSKSVSLYFVNKFICIF